jgi:hypothetical protein
MVGIFLSFGEEAAIVREFAAVGIPEYKYCILYG